MNNDASSRRKMRQRARNRRRTRRSAAAVAATVLSAGLVLGGLAPALAVPSLTPATTLDTAATTTATTATAAATAPQAIAPLAAPSIPSTGAAITVNLRALRAAAGGQTTASATAGIALELRNEVVVDSGATYGSTVVATCTTDADGDCSFILQTAPTSNGSRYWVVPTATAGADAFLSQYLVTGNNTDASNDGNRFATTPYAFRTPAITRSQTPYQVPATGLGDQPSSSRVGNPGLPLSRTAAASNRWNHYGTDMVATIDNPRFAPTCTPGLKVALIVDTSTSMTYNNNEGLNGARTASKAFANAFANKGVALGIYQFGNDAATVMAPTEVTSANLASITSKINGISVSGTQYTNWDRGIEQVAGADYDIAVMLTDGNPTRYRSNQGNGAWTDLRGVEEAVLSANLVKAQGTQLIAFGVGDYLNPNTPYNLASVTGGVQWTSNGGIPIGQADFAIPTSWDVVATQLGNLASSLTCEATVQVRKQERTGNGTLTEAAGWTFTATKTGAGTMSPSGAQTTVTGGAVPQPWRIAFTGATQTASVSITETAKPGWSVESVSCLKNGAAITGLPNAATFSLTGLKVGDAVVCTVVNGQAATVQANKTWVVKDSAGTTVGTYYQRGNASDPAVPAGLAATPALGTTPSPAWGTVYSGFSIGQQLALRETSAIDAQLLPGCVLTSQQLTAGNSASTGLPFDLTKGDYTATLLGGANVFEFTNTVTCTQTLDLVKVVAAPGTEKPSAWTLEAKAPSGALTGPKGAYSASTPVTASVSAAKAYTLSESGGPDTYVPASAGWQCVLTGTTTAVPVSNAKVTVPLGQKVTCTVTNTTAKLTLLKKTADGSGLEPGTFTLTGTPAAGFTLTTLQTPGAAAASAGNTFEVRPAHTYTLAESDDSGTIAYRNLALQKLKPGADPAVDANWETAASTDIQVAAGEHATYRFVNDKVPAVVLPLTGGTASDAYLLLGGAIVSAVIAVAAWRAARRMKRGTA